ncbi:FixH family protein [Mesobacillus harenae]|uniref:FixH family protein n=1 Tax=Mesobacillus harenae TaxID=2213203 RepID=UPI001581062E|nr:FixH family protein [Mesobacillus harenae]
MNRLILPYILLVFIAAGCGTSGESNQAGEPETVPEMLEVEVRINPEQINTGEEVTIDAVVTQGETPVEDADSVKFEITSEGLEEGIMLEGNHQSDGIYSVKKRFDQTGVYTVIAHVTARDMHNMPSLEFTVGSQETDTAQEQHSHKSADDGTNEDHHHHSGVSIVQTTGEINAGEQTLLTVSISQDGNPLSDASVRFEVWGDEETKHEYIDAAEVSGKAGQYQAAKVFPAAGRYHVITHLKKDKLHDHLVEEIIVQ